MAVKLTAAQKRNLAVITAAGPEGLSPMCGGPEGLTSAYKKLEEYGLIKRIEVAVTSTIPTVGELKPRTITFTETRLVLA